MLLRNAWSSDNVGNGEWFKFFIILFLPEFFLKVNGFFEIEAFSVKNPLYLFSYIL